MKDLPNYLTFLRLGLIPLFVYLMHEPSPFMMSAALVVFMVAAVTDLLDGIIARQFDGVSDVGKLLDPLADKILVMAALVMLVAQRSDATGLPWVPGWMVVLVLAREIWVTGLRAVAASHGKIVAAGNAGKLKSAFQMGAIVVLMLHGRTIPVLGLAVPAEAFGSLLLFVSIVLSYWSGAEYTLEILKAYGVGKAPMEESQTVSTPEG